MTSMECPTATSDFFVPRRLTNMNLLCTQCIHGFHQVRITGEGLECGRFIGLQQVAHLELLPIEIRELLPSQSVLPVAPDPLNGIQLWTVRRKPQGADIL